MKIRDFTYIFGYTRIKQADEKLLYGSAAFTPIKIARLKFRNINQIIDLREGYKQYSAIGQIFEKTYCKLFNIKYINLATDSKNSFIPNQDYYDKVNRTIEKESKTYIHCHYGKHRTQRCIAMYQRNKGVDEDTIVQNILENALNQKSDFLEPSYDSLLEFIKKFFPNKKHLKTIEDKKNIMINL